MKARRRPAARADSTSASPFAPHAGCRSSTTVMPAAGVIRARRLHWHLQQLEDGRSNGAGAFTRATRAATGLAMACTLPAPAAGGVRCRRKSSRRRSVGRLAVRGAVEAEEHACPRPSTHRRPAGRVGGRRSAPTHRRSPDAVAGPALAIGRRGQLSPPRARRHRPAPAATSATSAHAAQRHGLIRFASPCRDERRGIAVSARGGSAAALSAIGCRRIVGRRCPRASNWAPPSSSPLAATSVSSSATGSAATAPSRASPGDLVARRPRRARPQPACPPRRLTASSPAPSSTVSAAGGSTARGSAGGRLRLSGHRHTRMPRRADPRWPAPARPTASAQRRPPSLAP